MNVDLMLSMRRKRRMHKRTAWANNHCHDSHGRAHPVSTEHQLARNSARPPLGTK